MKSRIIWHKEPGQNYPSDKEVADVIREASHMVRNSEIAVEVSDIAERVEQGESDD